MGDPGESTQGRMDLQGACSTLVVSTGAIGQGGAGPGGVRLTSLEPGLNKPLRVCFDPSGLHRAQIGPQGLFDPSLAYVHLPLTKKKTTRKKG